MNNNINETVNEDEDYEDEEYTEEENEEEEYEENQESILSSEIDDDDGSELICVENESTQISEEGDGIDKCFVLIRKKRWEKINELAKLMKNPKVEHDHSSGGYSFILCYDVVEMLKRCSIYSNLTPDVIEFIRKIEACNFIDEMRQDIADDLGLNIYIQ